VVRRSDWDGLDDAAAALLARGLSRREYASGEVIFAQGDVNLGVHCVYTGAVAVRRLDDRGNSLLLALAYPGDTIGYHSFLAGTEHTASVEAVGPSVVCHIPRNTLAALLEAAPSVALHFLKRSIGEIEDANDKLFLQATLSHRHQLVHLLLVLVRRHGRRLENGSHLIELPVSRRDLASMIGTRQETVSRIIGRLETAGIAYFSGRQVTIPNVEILTAEMNQFAAA
jgi:CRP-like cAMP-binding protein